MQLSRPVGRCLLSLLFRSSELFVGVIIGRLLKKFMVYQWRKCKYAHLPAIFQEKLEGDDCRDLATTIRSFLFKQFPFILTKVSKNKNLEDFLKMHRFRSGLIRPLIFVGPTVAFEPAVSISDSTYFGKILTNTEIFPKYKGNYDLLKPILGIGLVLADGQWHKMQRKNITPVFHFNALKSALRVAEMNAVKFVEEELLSQGLVIEQRTFSSFSFSVIADYAFSGALNKAWMFRTWKNIMQALRLLNVLQIVVGDYVKYLPNPCSIYLLLVRWRIWVYLTERRRFLGRSGVSQSAVMTYLTDDCNTVSVATSPFSVDLGFSLADQLILAGCPTAVIIDECTTFLFAGQDTTSSLLAWAAYELARHPAEQAAVRAELRRVCGPGPVRAVPDEALRQLERTAAVLRETLRLWPPFPFLTRYVTAEGALSIDGAAVPCGAAASLSIFTAHRDLRFWPEPDAFKPSRWLLPLDSDEVRLRHPYAYLPFLAGPRNCIGQKFAFQVMLPCF